MLNIMMITYADDDDVDDYDKRKSNIIIFIFCYLADANDVRI